ncbi:site-specific integrase [Methanococcoides sp.]|uniref:site-specific integrase n=1 Tax=Methanococcoides sp. TaxID=1966350 RepID=UPI00272E5496|nr:site-specific integrase [Methanococcoides sp.]
MKHRPDTTGNNELILKKYEESLQLNGFKESTVNTKLWKVYTFLKYYNDKPVDDISKDDIQSYILHRRENRKPKTVHNDIVDLRLFFKWLKPDNDFFEGVKTKPQKNRLPVSELIRQDDITQLLTACDNQRDRGLVMTLWDSAARIGELLALNIRNVEFDRYGAVIIVNGKTGMRRLRLVDAVPDLQLWVNQHPQRENPDAPLFVTARKYGDAPRRLDVRTVQNLINTLSDHAGIKKNVHPHAFRHGRLTELVKRGFRESELRIIAGWEDDSKMPAVYIHMSGDDVEKKMLASYGIIEDEEEHREEHLKPIECPRCKTKNPYDSKYCSTCSMILDMKTALDDDAATALMMKRAEADPNILLEALKTGMQQMKN